MIRSIRLSFILAAAMFFSFAAATARADLKLDKGDNIAIIGNTLADRMQHHGWLETLIQARFPQHELVFRNLGFSADEVNTRPRSQNFGSPDQWLTKTQADVIFAFFGYNESFAGEGGLEKFRRELASFIDHTRKQNYSGKGAPQLVLFSPIAHENLKRHTLPDGSENNPRLAMYTKAMGEVARDKGVTFVDLFNPTQTLYETAPKPLTMNGIHLLEHGNRELAEVIVGKLFPDKKAAVTKESELQKLREAVLDKNFHWFNIYRTVDGYNVFGGRSKLNWHGQSNADVMRVEMECFAVMTANRDKRVWAIARGGDLVVKDDNLPKIPEVKTNRPGPLEDGRYPFLGGKEAIGKMKIAEGMQVNLFASEEMFPELINPVQMAVDTDGRLWVATWPSYPHWKPTEERRDKLVILPDDDGDGVADRMVTFADGLNSVTGFEFWGGGVLVAAAPEIWFLKDTDGDDKADVKIRMLQGVSSADTHHTANALVIGPDGGLYMSRGVFHVDNMETPTGTFRSNRSGVYRFDPRTFEFTFHFPIGPNPHGDVFDQWGYQFATDGTSGTGNYIAIGKGVGAPKQWYNKRVRPVAATGILSSSHFPQRNNGNFLICNVIGVLGVLQHEVRYDGADITAHEIEPILISSDPNFRPTDLEVAGDGALYVSDWHNPLIGHMQHNMRDPNRDDQHGRVYRVTYKGRPTLKPVKLKGKPIPQVLAAFYAKENGTRYRARLELSGRDTKEVIAATTLWSATINPSSPADEQALLEALWVFQEHRVPYRDLLAKVFRAKEPRVRAAAIRTLGDWGEKIDNWQPLLLAAARDESALVRAEAVLAAVSFSGIEAAEVIFEVATRPTDVQLDFNLNYAKRNIDVDRMVSDALNAGRKLSPAAMAYALQKSNVASLLKMQRTEAVNVALLSRNGVKAKDRLDAVASLAKQRDTTPLTELLAAIENREQRYNDTITDLAALLPQLPAQQLKRGGDDILKLARDTKNPQVRQAAYAALMVADGSADRVSTLANQSMTNMRAFLGALQLIDDEKTLSAVYPTVKTLTHTLPPSLKAETDANPGTVGRYVRIELPDRGTLTLAEVEVFSAGVNIAKGKEAKQSTVASGGDPQRAVDGDTNGVYNAGSATHTRENSRNPWWEVDLGVEQPIDAIKIWNRTDCCTDRLQGFTITVLNAGRSPVWTSKDNRLKEQSIAFKLGGDPTAAVHVAAINALSRIKGHDGETFAQLVELIASGKQRAAAVPALLKIKQPAWSPAVAKQLAAALRQYVPTIPLNQRQSAFYINSQTLAKEVASRLPEAEGKQLLDELSNLNLQVIRIETVPERMIYDKSTFAVVAGKPVRIVLANKDNMPHNLLVVEPGGAEIVGPLAETMGEDGFKKHFRPDSRLILHATNMVNPGETATLDFIAPTKPGKYEYVCTFPGHWRLMRGVMTVVATPAELPADAAGAKPRIVREWTIDDLAPDLPHISHGRSFDKGRKIFTNLGCAQCHKLGDEGGALGPDLNETFAKYKNNRRDVLEQIVDPAKVIEEKYKPVDIETLDGERLYGLVTERTKDHVLIVTNPQNPTPRKIAIDDIHKERESKFSMMPQGLLNSLERQEILDLLAYLESRGDKNHALFKGH